MAEEKARQSGEISRSPVLDGQGSGLLASPEKDIESQKTTKQGWGVPAWMLVAGWIACSGSVILYNKYILHSLEFKFPVILTTWHMVASTILTQCMARFTNILDARKDVPMTGAIYLKSIVPIGLCFSVSLIFGNLTYLYLTVSFIQMLKALTPVVVMLVGIPFGKDAPPFAKAMTVVVIVVGIMIASYGELDFVLLGVIYQALGIVAEATRLVMIDKLLTAPGMDPKLKMSPLVSLYYFAPICALLNFMAMLVMDAPNVTMADFERVGLFHFIANGFAAMALNISVVFLIGFTSGLTMTLCGVLKDLILVGASMLIFSSVITPTQWFGYSIALVGLTVYKTGTDKSKEYLVHGRRQWDEFGANRPATRKLTIFAVVTCLFFLVIGSVGPSINTTTATDAYEKAKGMVGGI